MAFVKLDCAVVDSTLWREPPAVAKVFLTLCCLAVPREYTEPEPQLHVDKSRPTGWRVPVGWYGFAAVAGSAVAARASLSRSECMRALKVLSSPDPESRCPDFDGRRIARVDGGYVVLNFIRYRERDHTVRERVRRFREKQRSEEGNGVTGAGNGGPVTQAEAEAENGPRFEGEKGEKGENNSGRVEIEAQRRREAQREAAEFYDGSDEAINLVLVMNDGRKTREERLAAAASLEDHDPAVLRARAK